MSNSKNSRLPPRMPQENKTRGEPAPSIGLRAIKFSSPLCYDNPMFRTSVRGWNYDVHIFRLLGPQVIILSGLENCCVGWNKFYNVTSRRYVFTLSSNQNIKSKYLIVNPFDFEIGPRGTKRYVWKIHLGNVNPRGVYLPEPKANTKWVSMLDTWGREETKQ